MGGFDRPGTFQSNVTRTVLKLNTILLIIGVLVYRENSMAGFPFPLLGGVTAVPTDGRR